MRRCTAIWRRQMVGLLVITLVAGNAAAATPRTAAKAASQRAASSQRAAASPRTAARAVRAQVSPSVVVPEPGPIYDEGYPYGPPVGGDACCDGGACGVGGGACGMGGGCGVMDCYAQRGLWVDLDYLLFARRGRWLPALATTGANGGVLPGATVLFGDDREGAEMRPGGRLRIGTWLDDCSILSVEGSFLALGDGRLAYNVDSSTTPTIARPFFNLTDNLQGGVVGPDALQVALAGQSTGSLAITSASDVTAWDVTVRGLLHEMGHSRLDLLVGYQGARINEDLRISSSTFQGSNQIDIRDTFATDNTFHGAAIGFELVHTCDRLNVELLGKVGFGNMKQEVAIEGFQQVTVGGTPAITAGGLLAQPTNIGSYQRDEFAINPEVGINFNYQLTQCINLNTGYTFMFWNKVVQPGEQIDPQLAVNPEQPPPANGLQRPDFTFTDSSYYIHGVHCGVQFVW